MSAAVPLPVISVVMRVYNTEAYLAQAAGSVLAQTFSDLELLLVDDGSTDGSPALCDFIASKDARVRVFHKPNGGPATASNTGLKNARGRYIGFVDSDDLAAPEMYRTLYDALTAAQTPMAACAGDAVDDAGVQIPGREVRCSFAKDVPAVMDAIELFRDAFSTGSFYGPLSWNKLFDIELFRKKHLCYDESMYYGDDASILHLLFEGEKIVCLPNTLYHYRAREGSITAGVFSPRKMDDLRMYWNWLVYFSARPDSADLYAWSVARYWQVFYLFWCLAGAAGNQKELRPAFYREKKHLTSILPELVRCPHISAGEKLRAVLFSANPTMVYALASAWGKISGRH
jgi:glycosyltransferase involved in cell wall biosynthesis